MPESPELAPFNVEELWLNSKILQRHRAPHTTLRVRSATLHLQGKLVSLAWIHDLVFWSLAKAHCPFDEGKSVELVQYKVIVTEPTLFLLNLRFDHRPCPPLLHLVFTRIIRALPPVARSASPKRSPQAISQGWFNLDSPCTSRDLRDFGS